jgi:two-component system LytT family response regulator
MPEIISALIVDDEAKARRILDTLLKENCPNVRVVDQAEDVPSAVKSILKHKPELVFLDIEMPNYTGFQLFDFFENPEFEVIFTTAYSDYAVQAFQVSAIDYLLKPIEIDQLKRAVSKFDKLDRRKTHLKERLEVLKINVGNEEQSVKKIALPVSDGLLFVSVSELIYLKADGAYTEIFMQDQNKVLVSKNLKEFEGLLTNPLFFKTHRSFIVNLSKVKQLVRGDGGYLLMENGDEVSLSKDRRDEFIKAFKSPV